MQELGQTETEQSQLIFHTVLRWGVSTCQVSGGFGGHLAKGPLCILVLVSEGLPCSTLLASLNGRRSKAHTEAEYKSEEWFGRHLHNVCKMGRIVSKPHA